MFVIMGATGQVGGAVLEALKQRGAAVRAVSRDPARGQGARCRGRARRRVGHGRPCRRLQGRAGGLCDAGSAYAGEKTMLAEADAASRSIATAVRSARVPHVVALSSIGAHLSEGSGIVRALPISRLPSRGPRPRSSSFGRVNPWRTGRRCCLSRRRRRCCRRARSRSRAAADRCRRWMSGARRRSCCSTRDLPHASSMSWARRNTRRSMPRRSCRDCWPGR